MPKYSKSGSPILMIVDDEPLARETFLEILRDEGLRTIRWSYRDRMAKRIRPDIILTDVIMPKVNGS
jgi:CheY-like chemotaxis protein